jgi:5-methylcytosine-specific restriction endonuclease McrA
MTEYDGPRLGRDRGKLKLYLCGCQNHRCAICLRPIKFLAYADDPARACAVKFDRSLPHGRKNSVACCARCAGTQSAYPSLLDFYEFKISGVKKKQKLKITFPDTINEINRQVAVQCAALSIPFDLLNEKSKFRFAPPESIPKIVTHRVKSFVERFNRPVPVKRIEYHLTMDKKIAFSEAQNHRCCYCSSPVNFIQKHPRQATWEHVVPFREQGSHEFDNVVIACSACNNLRDRMDVSAEEFYLWASTHREEIAQYTQSIVLRRQSKNLRMNWAKYEIVDNQVIPV